MSRFVCAVVLATLLLGLGSVASARNTGAQISIGLTTSEAIADSTSLTGDVIVFAVPENDSDPMYFVYGGLKRQFADEAQSWVQPVLGYAGNWFPYDGMVMGVWAGQTRYGLDLSFDGELVVGGGTVDVFGYHAVDRKIGPVKLGLHAEHVNEILQVGPHLKYGGFKAQYFVGAGKEALRFNASVNF